LPIRFIYFDCMDTLVQMDIPSMEVYADWAREAAAPLGVFEDRVSFRKEWKLHRIRQESQGGLREGTILGRIRDLLREESDRLGLGLGAARIESASAGIHERYWASYRSSAYVLPEVAETLERLSSGSGIPLGVLSNFMVAGGIPCLLADHGLGGFFQTVVVSCDHGWRKPSPAIFEVAIRKAGVRPEEILFVGDDLTADYRGAEAAGMNPLLYDPGRLHPAIERRIESFRGIEAWIPRGMDPLNLGKRDSAETRSSEADPCLL